MARTRVACRRPSRRAGSLSAALAFARGGRRVTLLERDGPIGNGGADELFDDWERRGIAHFRQPHNFLGLGRRVLLDEAPDVLDAVLGLGAVENRQYELLPGKPELEDESFVSVFARRPVEIALRRAVDNEPSLKVVTNTRVVDLRATDGPPSDSVRVTAARTDRGEEIEADLFVDALGRTSPDLGPDDLAAACRGD